MVASAVAGSLRVDMALNAGEFQRGVRRVEGSFNSLARQAQALGSIIAGAFAVTTITRAAGIVIGKFSEQEDAIAAVEAAVKATGGTAGFTTKKLAEMAGGLQKLSTYGDEDILKNLTANLLTFTNIVGPVFEEAQVAALNLSARLKQDLQSSVIQLGKALNDPIKGITALSRVGVAFTEQQKEQIKALMQSGDIMKAQKIILTELAHEFSGQAEAISKTTRGKLTQAFNAFGDALEQVGESIAPFVNKLADGLKYLAEGFQSLPSSMKDFVSIAGVVTVTAGALAIAVGVLAAAFGAVSLPITGIIVALGTLTGAVVAFWPQITRAAEAVSQAFQNMYNAAVKYLQYGITAVLEGTGAAITKFASDSLFSTLTEEIKGKAGEAAETAYQTGQQIGAAMGKGIADAKSEEPQAAPALSTAEAIKQLQERAAAEAAAAIQSAANKKGIADAQSELNKQIEAGVSLATQLQTADEKQAKSLAQLAAAYKAGKINAEQFQKAQFAAAMVTQNAYASMASQVSGALTQLFSKSKGVAIANALINTYESVTKALASYPPPFSFVAAGAALAAGLAQVANIRKQNASGGGGGGGGDTVSSGGGGGDGGGATQAASMPQTLTVQGIDPNAMFSGAAVKGLAEKLLAYQKDGGQVVLK
jgi:protein-disulfide isomerase-like protein with CxxC motif